jgi:hypothetical protein
MTWVLNAIVVLSINAFSLLGPKMQTLNKIKNLMSFPIPQSQNDKNKKLTNLVTNGLSGLLLLNIASLTKSKAEAISYSIDDKIYRNPLLNLQSDDFWYPPFLLGKWNTTLTFSGVKINNKLPVDKISQDNTLPGFSKYSVIFFPEMGKDVNNVILRFVDIDSHPREDHSFNARSLINAFIPSVVIDKALYNYQKAPNWFYSPANHWGIDYHDESDGIYGTTEIITKKRNIKVYAGTVETIEFIQQVFNILFLITFKTVIILLLFLLIMHSGKLKFNRKVLFIRRPVP